MLEPAGKQTSPTCPVAGQELIDIQVHGYTSRHDKHDHSPHLVVDLAHSLRRWDLTSTSSRVSDMAWTAPPDRQLVVHYQLVIPSSSFRASGIAWTKPLWLRRSRQGSCAP
jgi:hypothetical protein